MNMITCYKPAFQTLIFCVDWDFLCKIWTIGDEWTGQDFVADIRDCYIIQLVFIRDSF